ncbi:MAG TPA: glycosyl hydrolase [Baekduia sp.]|uniref:glycosyl hydrolase n=1 Tax=Baekduia sp. TaxID=2600305 RepID=UPI002D770FB0|nr:glycosyl hydrolase [Baekduia sp.]HET6508405.1 glycosyl hydrolase [Baekduia sp.]
MHAHAPVRHLRIALLVLLAVGACAVTASAAGAKALYGIQGVAVGTSPAKLAKELDAVHDLGMTSLRVSVDWSQLEPAAAGRYDATYLASLDRLNAAAAERQIKLIPFLVSTPCWASSAPDKAKAQCSSKGTPFAVSRYQPSDFAAFADTSVFLVTRLRANLAAYEVWNEPDQANENYWAGPSKVRNYVAMAKAAYGPLKAAAPEVPVIAGSFVGGNGKWLQALYDDGFKGSYDALAVHFYDLPLDALKTTRAVQLRNGDRSKLWLTEYGYDSCYAKRGPSGRVEHACLTQAGQAKAVKELIRATRSTSYVAALTLYELNDFNTDYQFGVFDRRGHRKTLYGTLRSLMRRPLPAATVKPRIRLSLSGGRLRATGTGSIIDTYSLTLRAHGQLRYRAILRTDRFGRFTVRFPASTPRSGVKVRIASRWTATVSSSASR